LTATPRIIPSGNLLFLPAISRFAEADLAKQPHERQFADAEQVRAGLPEQKKRPGKSICGSQGHYFLCAKISAEGYNKACRTAWNGPKILPSKHD
jgi:hypothetical protein